MATAFPWDDYRKYSITSGESGIFKHAFVQQMLIELQSVRPETMAVRELGHSVEGRNISLVTVGNGPPKVLLWSQMHGDEPTHTAVLLDLLNLLQRAPEHPFAQAILSGCTLYVIPLLNPDGAENESRFNAQDIDINRDARHLQSPEGRILRAAVDDLQPDFAFNLHNQNARTVVGPECRVATVSLLVPPVDPLETETENSRQAKQLASCFCQMVKDRCLGMISRYDADYMPRSFGEAIQASGVATLLIEAGDWPASENLSQNQKSPSSLLFLGSRASQGRGPGRGMGIGLGTKPTESKTSPLVQLHFVGLISTLYAIATDSYRTVDPDIYEQLPRSNEHRQFDLLIRGSTITNGMGHEPFVADLGINHIKRDIHHCEIVEIGDLGVTTGKQVLDANELICQPGHAIIDSQTVPHNLPTLARCQELLAEGVTNVIGVVDLADARQVERLIALESQPELPMNLGFVGSSANFGSAMSDTQRDQLLQCISSGLLGLLSEGVTDEVRKYAEWFDVPIICPSPIGSYDDLSPGILPKRGIICRGAAANLLLLNQTGDLRSAIVGGIVVFDDGKSTGKKAGILLCRS